MDEAKAEPEVEKVEIDIPQQDTLSPTNNDEIEVKTSPLQSSVEAMGVSHKVDIQPNLLTLTNESTGMDGDVEDNTGQSRKKKRIRKMNARNGDEKTSDIDLNLEEQEQAEEEQHQQPYGVPVGATGVPIKRGDLSVNREDIKASPIWRKMLAIAKPEEVKLLRTVVQGTAETTKFAATLAFFAGLSASAMYAPMLFELNKHMGLHPVRLHLLNASPNILGSVLRIPAGVLLEIWPSRKVHFWLHALQLCGLLPLAIIMLILYPNQFDGDNVFWPLFFCGLLCGAGSAIFSAGIPTVGLWMPQEKQGSALGFYAGIGNSSVAFWMIFMPGMSWLIGLEGAYCVWLQSLAFVVYLSYTHLYDNPYSQLWFDYWRAYEENPHWDLPQWNDKRARQLCEIRWQQVKFPTGDLHASLMGAIRLFPVILFIMCYMVSFGGFLGISAWMPYYYSSYFKLNSELAGLCTFSYAIIASLGRWPIGVILDGTAITPVLSGYIAIGCGLFGSIIFVFSKWIWVSIIGGLFFGLSHGIMNGTAFKVVPKISNEYFTGAAAWIGSIGAMGGFFWPVVMAIIASEYEDFEANNNNWDFYHQMPWLLFIILNAIALVLWALISLFIPSKHVTREKDQELLETLVPATREVRAKRKKKARRRKMESGAAGNNHLKPKTNSGGNEPPMQPKRLRTTSETLSQS